MSESDEQELKEAAALRCAIDEGVASEDVPADALEAAALLRYKSGHGELDAGAKQRVLGELLELQAKKRPAPRRRGVFGALALAASLAATFTLFTVARAPLQSPVVAPRGPRPKAELIQALGAAVAKEPGSADKLEHAMRPFRKDVLRALRGTETAEITKPRTEWRAER